MSAFSLQHQSQRKPLHQPAQPRSILVLCRHVWVGLLLCLSACASTAPQSAPEAQPASPGPALWSLSDADTTVYLFGTVHILKPDVQWRAPHVTAAWQAADSVYFEAETESRAVQAEIAALVQTTGVYNDGRSLLAVLNPEQQQTLTRAAEQLGLPLQTLAPLKPWMAGLQLSLLQMVQAGYDAQSGVEMVLSADAGDRQRGYLETAQAQIRLLGDLPEPDQIDMLMAGARAIVEDPEILDRLVQAWTLGDTEELAIQLGSVNAFGSDAVYEALLTQRNRQWVPLIKALLDEPGVKFVAVGAGHLAGADSVIAMLRAEGLSVMRQ